jgi:hypothetical protein
MDDTEKRELIDGLTQRIQIYNELYNEKLVRHIGIELGNQLFLWDTDRISRVSLEVARDCAKLVCPYCKAGELPHYDWTTGDQAAQWYHPDGEENIACRASAVYVNYRLIFPPTVPGMGANFEAYPPAYMEAYSTTGTSSPEPTYTIKRAIKEAFRRVFPNRAPPGRT